MSDETCKMLCVVVVLGEHDDALDLFLFPFPGYSCDSISYATNSKKP